ncbi:1,4-alpha-glucan branching protein GlgB [Saccharothrix obliqua]|uniref:1,4-alpha-glucan branching protein GlgB n=1 Tax=Saccharothrix obliqua TaxID=2861747 RepID=UPI001C5EF774|nr:1,4-alpha-glucan branching protein GlgB [Saccharothrix obliqua]MBW4717734.1 1,4-alpha-glucan branching protein GlgB [Saccharothrix obliqua]
MTTVRPELLPPQEEVDRLLVGDHPDPHAVLGAHPAGPDTVVRTLQPGATAVHVLTDHGRHPLAHVSHGLFAGFVPGEPTPYRLEVERAPRTDVVTDPYTTPPTVSDGDVALIGRGEHPRLWDVLGAHPKDDGVAFAVWAPNARGVRVAGDFDDWSGRGNPMRHLGSGVWEVFVPGVRPGCRYKFRVLGVDGAWREHADPMASATETPPANASVVTTTRHRWTDDGWLARRAATDWHDAPISVYEVHLGSWRAGLSYRELATALGDYLVETGFTHVELMPVTEHPFGGSWGYQTTSYFAPTARFGTPDEFRHLVDHLHSLGIGVLLDWVPAHFPRDAWALARFDGTPLYEHADPRRGEHPDWGTLVFDLGRPQVRNFLVASALHWLEEYHLDGLRVDAVASMLYLDYSRRDGEWLPNEFGGRENLDAVAFLRELNTAVRTRVPGAVVIAEESTAWPGVTSADGLGFGFKWNMGWMHDTLHYLRNDPVHRVHHHGEITHSVDYAWSERYMLPLSHDEVVHGKGSLWQRMPGDDHRKAAGVRTLLAYQWAHPGKQLLFMGGEFGQPWEWNADDSLAWWLLAEHGGMNYHRGIQRMVADLNATYRREPALHTLDHSPDGFAWTRADDAEHNVIAFRRIGSDGSVLVCVANFAGVPHEDYRLGLPHAGTWREVLNTDRRDYGGSGVVNDAVRATAEPLDGLPASASLRLPATGVVWLAPA